MKKYFIIVVVSRDMKIICKSESEKISHQLQSSYSDNCLLFSSEESAVFYIQNVLLNCDFYKEYCFSVTPIYFNPSFNKLPNF